MNHERISEQTELEHTRSPVFYKTRLYPELGQWQEITYYQKYTAMIPIEPERTTFVFGSERKWRKQMAEYNELEASKIQLYVNMPRDLLDVRLLESIDDQQRGYATPELYGESISESEFIKRIESLATWIDPRAGVDVQQKYQAIAELKENNAIATEAIIDKYNRQLARHDEKGNVEMQNAKANSTNPWDEFREGVTISAKNLFEGYTIIESRTREIRQLEYKERNLEQSTGLSAFTYSIASALQRMQNPGQFMADYRNELVIIEQANQKFIDTAIALRDANQALVTIGNDTGLIEHKTTSEAAHATANQDLRIQSIRLCYIAMQYDQGVRTPVATYTEALPQPIAEGALQEVVATIGGAVKSDAPESLTVLANKLIAKLYNIPTSRNNIATNRQIAEYFAQTSTLANSDLYVDAISRQIAERFGDYLNS